MYFNCWVVQRQIKYSLMVVLFLATLTGCSFKTVYNQLDYLIPQYIQGMVTLDEVLEQKLEQRTLVLLNWHRNTQLKEYAYWLQTGQHYIGPKLTEAIVDQQIGELELFWNTLFAKVNEEMSKLLPLLDAQQQNELFSNIAKDNEEFRKQYVERDERERVHQIEERLLESYEKWLGDLNGEQILAVKQVAREFLDTADLRLRQRLDWQRGIQTILASEDARPDKTRRLRAFLNDFQQGKHTDLREKWAVNRRLLAKLTVQIAHTLNEKQHAHFINKTNKYINMFIELAEKR